MAPNWFRHKADKVKPQLNSKAKTNAISARRQCQRHPPRLLFKDQAGITFHNMPRSKACKIVILLCCKINMHLPETAY